MRSKFLLFINSPNKLRQMSIKIKRQRKVMRKKYDQEGITETVNTVTVREKKNHSLIFLHPPLVTKVHTSQSTRCPWERG